MIEGGLVRAGAKDERMKTFISLAVEDVDKSRQFFAKLGFGFNDQLSDERVACLVVSADAYVMLQSHEKFEGFINKKSADTTNVAETLLALTAESKEAVDRMHEKVVQAGGKVTASDDLGGWKYVNFEDPDGHTWGYFWMDLSFLDD